MITIEVTAEDGTTTTTTYSVTVTRAAEAGVCAVEETLVEQGGPSSSSGAAWCGAAKD